MKRKFLSIILAVALSANMTVGVSAGDVDITISDSASDENVESEDVTADISVDAEKDEEDADVEVEEDEETEPREDEETEELDLFDSEEDVFSDGAMDAGVTEHGIVGGYIPSAADYNVPVYDSGISMYSELPSAFPDNVDSVRQKYPDNRDQNPYGTCWAFASTGLAEFDLINKGIYNKNIDLSELQLAYFTYNSVQDPLGGTAGDYAKYYNENATANYLNYGGNYEMAARRMSQWVGSTAEADVQYNQATNVLKNGLNDEYAYNHDVAHLKNAYIINIKSNADAVKENIMNRGAVGVMYYHNDKFMLWNDAKQLWTYYDTDYSGGGHAVMIVGWDDNFSKDNFVGTEKPASDGAWLVRNSWGIVQSYFWMSYESTSLSESAWAFDVSIVDDDEYDNNYQLDGGLQGYPSECTTVSNVYTVGAKENVTSETLKAISISCMKASGVNYSIDIYTDLKNKNNPASGTLQTAAHTEGITAYAGIYTIPLESEVKLKPESSFAVVVKVDKKAIDYEQATKIVSNVGSADEKTVWDCAVSLDNRKSFYGYGSNQFGSWPWGNFCIKAFTTNNKYKITYNLNGGENNADNPMAYGGNDEPIILKAPTRGDGYAFAGWYLDEKFTNPITEIPANASGDYTLYAKWVSATGEKFASYSLNLNGNISINMYMELPDELKSNPNAYMKFALPNGTVSKVKVSEARQKEGYYIFTGKVAAKEMTKDVKVRMYADDNDYGKEYTVNVRNYADYILKHQEEYGTTAVNLIKSMLNYGAASQELFGYETNNLANSILSAEDRNVTMHDFENDSYKYSYVENTGTLGIKWYGSSLLLKSDTCVRDYFYLDGPSGIDAYSFYKVDTNGTETKLQPVAKTINGETYYYVDIPDIKAQDLDQSIKVIVKNSSNEKIISLKYNAFNYAYALWNNETPDEKSVAVMNAMYSYWENAKAYVNSKNK